jgi:hypothetical protein
MPVIKMLEYHEITSTTGWWDEEEAENEAFHEHELRNLKQNTKLVVNVLLHSERWRRLMGKIFLLIRENSTPARLLELQLSLPLRRAKRQ